MGLRLSVSVSPCLYVGRQIDRHVSMHTRTHYQWLTPNRIPKGAHMVYTLAPKHLYRNYTKANAYTFLSTRTFMVLQKPFLPQGAVEQLVVDIGSETRDRT